LTGWRAAGTIRKSISDTRACQLIVAIELIGVMLLLPRGAVAQVDTGIIQRTHQCDCHVSERSAVHDSLQYRDDDRAGLQRGADR
jgi:hypothetical protein